MSVTLGFLRSHDVEADLDAWADTLATVPEGPSRLTLVGDAETVAVFRMLDRYEPPGPGEDPLSMTPIYSIAFSREIEPEKERELRRQLASAEAALFDPRRDVADLLLENIDAILPTSVRWWLRMPTGPLAGCRVVSARDLRERLFALFEDIGADGPPIPMEPAALEELYRFGEVLAHALDVVDRHELVLRVSW